MLVNTYLKKKVKLKQDPLSGALKSISWPWKSNHGKQKFICELEEAKKQYPVGSLVENSQGITGMVSSYEELHHYCSMDVVNNSWKFILVEFTTVLVKNTELFTETNEVYMSTHELSLVGVCNAAELLQ